MIVLKFECPGCGQTMECDRACAGDVIHCPRCTAELRIPFNELPGAILRAELILHAPDCSAAPASAIAEPVPQTTEALCPICESHLRVSANGNSKPGTRPPLAELVRKGSKIQPAESRRTTGNEDRASAKQESHPDIAHMTIEERERHIAMAREAHPVQINSPVKPRLSYVLSGEAPVPHKEAPDKTDDGGK
jgi:hypothetical protein